MTTILWIFLSVYWPLQLGTYIEIQDYVNAFLVVAAAVVSLSRAASVGGLLYFLFAGIISSATGAPAARKLRAFMISVPVIYILNLQRLAFTASAYGFSWFLKPFLRFRI